MANNDDHAKIYALALQINMIIDGLEKEGYSLETPFPMSVGDLKGLTKRIQSLEEENITLKLELKEAHDV